VGVWWGLVVANITGSLIAFSWARFYIGRLKDEFAKESESFKKSIFHG
jgi:uncharacterized membrane protein YdjX (TVP38/TMEM64 family)